MESIMKNFSIKETDKKLRNGELLPKDFASPDYDRFKDMGVIVHPNVYLTWDKIKITYALNITKLKKDITIQEKSVLKLSFDTKGVDRTKPPPAINPIPNADGTHDYYYGFHREDIISPETAGWVFTPLTIPPELKRRVLCGENEEEYPQTFNSHQILADNLIIDIEDGYCEKDDAALDAYLLDAYPSRTNTQRKAIKDIVTTHYRRSDTPITPAKFIILDSIARINEWNTNHNTEEPMYSLAGNYDEERKSYIFTSKGEEGSIERIVCRLGEKLGRGIDLDESEMRKTEVIFHVGQAENRKELLKLRITALRVFDKTLKWMKQLGMDVSHFYVLGFIAQETGVEKGLIPIEEIRKHMK